MDYSFIKERTLHFGIIHKPTLSASCIHEYLGRKVCGIENFTADASYWVTELLDVQYHSIIHPDPEQIILAHDAEIWSKKYASHLFTDEF